MNWLKHTHACDSLSRVGTRGGDTTVGQVLQEGGTSYKLQAPSMQLTPSDSLCLVIKTKTVHCKILLSGNARDTRVGKSQCMK